MSNSLAIATVTATLRDILKQVRTPLPGDPDTDPDLADADVTTRPLDKARPDQDAHNSLNVFLYETLFDAALRNSEIPQTARNGESKPPPVALRLRYLISAFGRNNDELLSHRMMGRAMSLLQDRAVLLPGDIEAAMPGTDLHRQIERVRITSQPLSTEEMSKLWTIFQVNYRLSVAYEVSVVLIDSARLGPSPLPVLRRGSLDRGVAVFGSITPPFPTLLDLQLPAGQPSARLASGATPGDVVTLVGHHLDGSAVTLQLSHRLLSAPLPLPAMNGATSTQVQLRLPLDDVNWPAGFYTVAAVVSRPGEPDRTSNSLAFSVAPRAVSGLPGSFALGAGSSIAVNLGLSPQVWPGQRASLLIDGREVRADPHPAKTANLGFTVNAPALGVHVARARVDGVDSLAIADYTARPPAFDSSQQITVTP